MAIVFDSDAGTITGISVGGLPDGVVDAGTLATDSVTAAKIPDTVEAGFKSGRKNMVINGAMQVSQRGTSSTSDGYATVDRFFTYKESCEQLAVTQTQSTTAPDGFASSYKLDVTTAETATEANDQYEIVTRLEGQDLQHLQHNSSGAKSVTLSFWVRSSKTGTYCVALYKRDTTRNITSTYAISSANTWEKKTVTFVGDTSGAIDNDANRSLDISWKLLIGSNFTGTASTTWGSTTDARSANGHTATWGSSTSDDFYLTGVQLEVGSTATDFEHRPYGEELALCHRYFERFDYDASGGGVSGIAGQCFNTGVFYGAFGYQRKRADPSFSTSTISGSNFRLLHSGTATNVTAMSAIMSRSCARVQATVTSGLTQGRGAIVDTGSSQGQYIDIDAEL
jgi:hypothetical protein